MGPALLLLLLRVGVGKGEETVGCEAASGVQTDGGVGRWGRRREGWCREELESAGFVLSK